MEERERVPSSISLASLGTNDSNVTDTLLTTEPSVQGQQSILTAPPSTESGNRAARLSPSSSNSFLEANETEQRSSTTGHFPLRRSGSTLRWNSSELLLQDLDFDARDESSPGEETRIYSFLNRRRTTSKGHDIVELSSVSHNNFISETDYDSHIVDETDEPIDDSDTAQLTAQTIPVTQHPQKRPASFHENQVGNNSHVGLGSLGSPRNLGRMSQLLARISSRVVNLHNLPRELLQQNDISDDLLTRPSSKKTNQSWTPEEGGISLKRFGKKGHASEITIQGKDPVHFVPKTDSPLTGHSLFIFGPNNPLRVRLYKILNHPWAETFILCLIIANVALLTARAWNPLPYNKRPTGWPQSWIDFALLVIFIIYTLEVLSRIIVSGFLMNSDLKQQSSRTTLKLSSNNSTSVLPKYSTPDNGKVNIDTVETSDDTSTSSTKHASRSISSTPFFRHSFNRIDLLAVISFWIDLALTLLNVQHFYVFKAMAALRGLRLLAITSGTSTILVSLKKSAPLLVNVAFFVFFFFIIFSIIAVQSFKGSFLRHCVYIDDNANTSYVMAHQLCGGHMNASGSPLGSGSGYAKGYICPQGQICVETGNPYNGTVNFDNIFFSMVLVFVISGVQNWTDLMYQAMDSDYDIASLFFIAVVLILNFWLINLFIAVICEMFAKIREDTSHSAFTLSKTTPVLSDDAEGWTLQQNHRMKKVNLLHRLMEETKYVWILAIFVDIIIMSLQTYDMNDAGRAVLSQAELIFTIIFAIEIILRFGATLPDYPTFFRSKQNNVDLFLAIVTCVIQIPLIKNSTAYPYLTAFQIMRAYRVVIALPRMKNLLNRVLGSAFGLANLILFIILINFISAIIAVQLFLGDIPDADDQGNPIEMRFNGIFNSFAALYQLFSGENWPNVLYAAMSYENSYHGTVVTAIFLLLWFSLSNFVLLNMFIAIVQENFSVAEEEKHKHQLQAFLRKAEPKELQDDIIDSWNVYRFFKAKPKSLAVENIPSSLILPTQKSMVREFLTGDTMLMDVQQTVSDRQEPPNGFIHRIRRFFNYSDTEKHILFSDTRKGSATKEIFDDSMNERPTEAALDDIEERQAIRADFIKAHPNYDESLWILSPRNRIRRFCQLLVPPSYGERIFGTKPSPTLSLMFSLIVFLCIVASVVIAAYTNPLFQRTYFSRFKDQKQKISWFWITDTTFTGVFTIEFLVKIIADGFLFTPNAYLLNVWNVLDFFVLGTLYVNIIATFANATGVSRAVRAFKALRALRLINLSSSIKDTFYAILIAGFPRILDAAILSISLIIPFAIYGQNVFSGLLFYCNDSNSTIQYKSNCTGEYQATPLNGNFTWSLLEPRVWDNPYVWSFDNFRSALLILFEIVSGEGWIDVMTSVMSINGHDQQPGQDNSPWNAVFFMVFNLAGAVFVLTLFVSVIIENYITRSGAAFLTADQRLWMDLKKVLKRLKPSKRPKVRPSNPVRAWCYDVAIQKSGWLSRLMTVVYILHICNLMTEYQGSPPWLDTVRDIAFLLFIFIAIFDICVKLTGFGWSVFRANKWNLYDLFVVSGAAITTVISTALPGDHEQAIVQPRKLFLVAIAFKLFQKSDSLNQLFKTMVGSWLSIFNLFAVWFVVFCVYSITFMEIFGLTKYGTQGTKHVHFRDFWTSLLTLIRMSTGEGWNTIMHDFTVKAPLCVDADSYLDNDCGSPAWAYFLFISWNVLSMYIFANMFIVVVIDNFSYCWQIAAKFSLVTREEIRKFKKAWGSIDVNRTGYITSKDFPKFFKKLSGSFEIKIYEEAFQIPNLTKNSLNPTSRDRGIREIDLVLLENNLSGLDQTKVRERRRLYNQIYQEALLTVERDSKGDEKGISFTNMLLMLGHYKLIDDDTSLEIGELLRRKEKMERVSDNVNRERVKSLLKTIYWRRKFKDRKEELRASTLSAGSAVPRITVDEPDAHTPYLRIETSFPDQPTRSSQMSVAYSGNSPISPISPTSPESQLSEGYNSRSTSRGYSLRLSEDFGDRNQISGGWRNLDPNSEMDDVTADQVLNTLQNNIWHGVLQEVSEENPESNP